MPDPIRKQLAIDIQEIGGPFEVGKEGHPKFDRILYREPYETYLKTNKKRPLQNLFKTWKDKEKFKTTEDWLAKVYTYHLSLTRQKKTSTTLSTQIHQT